MKFEYYEERVGNQDFICVVTADRPGTELQREEHGFVRSNMLDDCYELVECIYGRATDGKKSWESLTGNVAFIEGPKARKLFKAIQEIGYMDQEDEEDEDDGFDHEAYMKSDEYLNGLLDFKCGKCGGQFPGREQDEKTGHCPKCALQSTK
tara:strand:+ start:505 stop:957 length:453 start_codon:yes stop_codon:yes gene_type:complete